MKDVALYPQTTSAGSSVSSVAYDLGDLTNYSIAVDFTGTNLAGTLKLQASNDGTDFVDVAGSSQAITGAASHIWNVTGASYRYVRVAWAYTSGTGDITARLIAKENVVKGA